MVPVYTLVHPKGAILQVIVPVADPSAVVKSMVNTVSDIIAFILNSLLKTDSLAPEITIISLAVRLWLVEVVTVATLLVTEIDETDLELNPGHKTSVKDTIQITGCSCHWTCRCL